LNAAPGSNVGITGKVVSAKPMFVKTPIRTLPRVADAKEIYTYIKQNNLHTGPREASLSEIKNHFSNSERDIEKIYEDSVLSIKATEVDNSYGYATDPSRSVDLDAKINEGYEQLKKLGIV